ncbi:P-loop NTPase family protein [Merismopedia glauca]|uniref:Cob(I)yrinic acid a c-diamide adenosyltransferase n=1 Tax=Merismopedia glauca CCAP 1448/3 TaxID=1296344 RepID=A0A2T1C1Q3_9CYAN|nr:P-loop NTPase family protein [Merismopedia glauca]PSB02206.1 cob(I)yrinic acid a c-diamide adenosyltransferase [Merismopedia glauca CCAP 1448/3]
MVAQLDTPVISSPSHSPYLVEGLVQVFTASRRSFFTTVMAQALRIAGQGRRVLVVQFLKGGLHQGSERPVRLCQNLDWIRCNLPRCLDTPHLEATETDALVKLWEHTRNVVLDGQYSLVILDEVSLAVNLGLLLEKDVLELVKNRPPQVDIVLTGPEMPETILSVADQVTKIRLRDHRC